MKDQISIDRVKKLHPEAIGIFQRFIEEIEEKFNTVFRVAQGFRTFEEQTAIYNQPWDKKDNDGDGKIDEKDEKVSNAKAGQSFHNYGVAIDIVEMRGKAVNWNFDYSKLEPIAKKYGLYWGGNFGDNPHFELTFGYTWQQLLEKYNKKDFIPGTTFVKL